MLNCTHRNQKSSCQKNHESSYKHGISTPCNLSLLLTLNLGKEKAAVYRVTLSICEYEAVEFGVQTVHQYIKWWLHHLEECVSYIESKSAGNKSKTWPYRHIKNI